MQTNFVNYVIALALVVIAINMTYTNTRQPATTPPKYEEKIVEIVGRVTSNNNGLGGADTGFLVKDGSEFKIVHYDQGSQMDLMTENGWKPQYLSVAKYSNGRTAVIPLLFDRLD